MEPIIYKPGAYKSPGIYNGAGGIYNGRGVYKDGASISGLIYETDFSNFDFENLTDYPLVGSPKAYSFTPSYYDYTTVTVDGVTYNCLKHKTGTGSWLEINFEIELMNENIYTVEFDVYKPSYSGTGGYCCLQTTGTDIRVYAPYLNCYSSGRGYGVGRRPRENIVATYNGFSYSFEYYYYPSNSELKSIAGVCTAGVTIDKNNSLTKTYTKGKKALTTSSSANMNFHKLAWWSDANMELYLLGIRIIKADIFNTKE